MPPKKQLPDNAPTNAMEGLFNLFQKMNGTTAYRFAMFVIVLSVTPFSKLLPRSEHFIPLWEQVDTLVKSDKQNKEKLDTTVAQVNALNAQIGRLDAQVQKTEAAVQKTEVAVQKTEAVISGFQVDFERFKNDRK